ncbi:Uncharacterised protein [uncultured archaeon]|nr:Uncharacterised protein [uncultured archaeon]
MSFFLARALPVRSPAFSLFAVLFLLSLFLIPTLAAQSLPSSVQNQQNAWANSGLIQYITGSKFSPPLVAALICALVAALLLMAAVALGSEELKQFVRAELGQAIVTVLIVICIVGIVTGLDVALEHVAAGITSPCLGVSVPASVSSGLTMNQYAYCYVSNLYDLARQAAGDSLGQSVTYARNAYSSTGVMTTRWFLLYVGFSIRPNADQRLDAEVKGQEFNLHETYLVSLLSQRYVLQTVAPALGSAALFLGVLLRALFYTRRLGGLLIAAGIGLLLVWPATYLLAWVTLNVAVFGPQAVTGAAPTNCPASCLIQPPYGYKTTNANGAAMGQDTLSANQIEAIASANSLSSRDVENMLKQGVQPCYPASSTPAGMGAITYEDSSNCPSSCRFYPTPPDCNATACAALPRACKTIRAINLSDPADDCVGLNAGANPANPNKDWLCKPEQCPNFCKQLLPQVKADLSGGFNGLGVAVSDHADLCSTDSDCQKCTLFLRRYNYNGDAASITSITSNANCQACMAKYKEANPSAGNQQLPDCMTGVPTLLSGVCDAPAACGPHISLADWLSQGASATGVCPVDCRILFASDGSQNAYKDPDFVKYCESDPIKTACSACPLPCKINASAVGAGGSTHVPQSPGMASPVTCAVAPTYTPPGSANAKLDPVVTDNCALCPLSCRFRNLNLNPAAAPFLSSANYPLTCYYYPDETPVCGSSRLDTICTAKLLYKTPSNPNACPKDWLQYDQSNSVLGATCPTIDAPDCAPSQQVWALAASISDSKCPRFISNSPQYVNSFALSACTAQDGWCPDKNDILCRPGYMLASVQPNTDASAECYSSTALKYCNSSADPDTGRVYCPDSCKADRQEDGPFYCTLSSINDKNAKISDNNNRCSLCYSVGASNSLGPQCQVLLLDESGSKAYFPRGCDDTKCAVGPVDSSTGQVSLNAPYAGIDPKNPTGQLCNGFCFPRLQIPSSASNPAHPECAAYSSTVTPGTTGPDNLPTYSRAFAGGASCPLNCRYDYMGKRPASNMAYCGDGFAPDRCGSCQYASDTLSPTVSFCQNAQHYMDCSTVYKSSGGQYWFRGDDVQNYDSQYTHPCAQSDTACKNYEKSKTDAGYTYTTGAIYSCSELHKYPTLDTALGYVSAGNYRECGDLSLSGSNSNLNLCNQFTASPYSSSKPMPSSCVAGYDARTVACQPLVSQTTTPAPYNCLNCPLFCRSIVNGQSICSPRQGRANTGWDRGGAEPNCGNGASETCDMRTANSPANSPSFLPGFCGVNSAAFNLVPPLGSGTCQLPNEGYAVGCPARCRILLGGDPTTLPIDCQTPEIGEACNISLNLPLACRSAPPSRLCEGCRDCQTDCTALPLVRQNCQELCLPSDVALSGRSSLSPNDLISSMGGAAGNTDWRNLGNEAIAVFILPMFCILITLSFIRALSPFLGGEIELPGILKLI